MGCAARVDKRNCRPGNHIGRLRCCATWVTIRLCERSEAIQKANRSKGRLDCFVALLLAMTGNRCRPAKAGTTSNLSQMLLEKRRGAIPGELRRLSIMHRHALFVDEGVVGVIAEKLERFAGFLHRLLESVDHLRRAPIVAAGEMRLQGNPDI